jgi:hypothetical protein
MVKRKSIPEWIQEAVDDDQHGDACTMLAVVHLTGDGAVLKEIDRMALPSQLSVRDIASRFEDRVAQHIYDMSGHQNFAVYAFYDMGREPGLEYRFARAGTLQLSVTGGVSEPATEKGLLQQTMRHHHDMAVLYMAAQKEVIQSFAQLARSAVDNNAALTAETEQLRRELAESRKILDEAAAALERSAMEGADKLRKDEENSAMRRKFMEWAPALINTIMGKKVFPEATEDSSIINGLLDSMEPEHVSVLVSMVQAKNPTAAGVLSARANEILRKRRELAESRGEVRELVAPAAGAVSDVEGELQ